MNHSLRRAAFLDRDKTIIDDPGYLSDPDLVAALPGALDGLALLRERGWMLVLISNQAGVGRGLISPEAAARVHDRFVELLAERGIALDGAYYCPHAPWDGCDCRKPQPGMLLRAARELRIDLARSVMIGDKLADVAAGRRAGCRTVRIAAGGPSGDEAPDEVPDYRAPNLLAAAHWIVDMLPEEAA
jgi:D-glycero-D-manno-heptose 1,7-bisphosphate phosphatase